MSAACTALSSSSPHADLGSCVGSEGISGVSSTTSLPALAEIAGRVPTMEAETEPIQIIHTPGELSGSAEKFCVVEMEARTVGDGEEGVALKVPFLDSVGTEPVAAPPTFHCQICLSTEQVEAAVVLSGCGHLFCHDCLVQYLVAHVTEGNTKLLCPHFSEMHPCRTPVPSEQVEKYLDVRMAQRYVRLRNLEGDPNLVECPFCELPQRGCAKAPAMACPGCRRAFCFRHSNAHGPRESCSAYERRVKHLDGLSLTVVSKTSKPCPGCHAPTFKHSGCNHMSCSRCSTQWCWMCGGLCPSVSDHFARGVCAGMQHSSSVRKYRARKALQLALRLLFYPVGGVLLASILLLCLPVVALSKAARSRLCQPDMLVPLLGVHAVLTCVALPFLAVGWVAAVVAWAPMAVKMLLCGPSRCGAEAAGNALRWTLKVAFFPAYAVFLWEKFGSVVEDIADFLRGG